ncbi:MAG TPA: peptidylprolyl isomerase [Bacteroidales bacterium]|nr:peptidylprolyl isomerase [Bacteroidales bacterium]HPS62963.1 peptidylprolyl isomerase [Bacteroidales bacterium]
MKIRRAPRFLSWVIWLAPLCVAAQSKPDTIIDGVVGIVGANVILKSDVENQYLQIRSQGNILGTAQKMRCQIFENLLYQKLLLHQSQVDSLTATDAQVEAEMDRRMRYFISQAGTPERLEEHFGKSLLEIKNELRDVIREQMLTEQEQQKITKDITVTPSEVRSFFRKIPKDSIPLVNSEFEIGTIVKRPVIGEAERQEARDRLKGFRERIAKGDDFSTLAVLYSEDPGSSKQGGELGMFKRGEMRAEFEAAAFKLKPGEVSDIVETEDGFHLIQMIERRGDYVNARHILVQPKVSPVNLNRARQTLDSVAGLISSKKMTYDAAVMAYSDDPGKNSGGLMINPATGNSRWEADQIDAKVFFVVDKLKPGEVSAPVLTSDRGKQDYRIYFLKSRSNPHKANLEDDYSRIHQLALEKKKEEKIDSWINEKRNSTFISIMDEFRNCTFQRNWIKN